MRFSAAEYESLRAQAAERHCTFSDLVRRVVLEHPLPPQRLPAVDAEVARQLAKIGVNLNQLAHNMNRAGDLASVQKAAFWREGVGHLDALNQVLQALRAKLLQ